jgi:hypothetical protein
MMGEAYWRGLLDRLRASTRAGGKIGPADLELITLTDDVDIAVDHIAKADAALPPL